MASTARPPTVGGRPLNEVLDGLMTDKELSRFEVLRKFTNDDLADLESKFGPKLASLRIRYASDLSMGSEMLDNPQYLDVLRTAWFLDRRWLKPSAKTVTGALGYAFGCLLGRQLNMDWCEIRDSYGEALSMVYLSGGGDPTAPERVSFPPFNYIEKRETIGNAEVFQDGLRTVRRLVSGQAV
jgi:hypothetical protein